MADESRVTGPLHHRIGSPRIMGSYASNSCDSKRTSSTRGIIVVGRGAVQMSL
jgi:hypothetical protein